MLAEEVTSQKLYLLISISSCAADPDPYHFPGSRSVNPGVNGPDP
jgi:hypothetical protein